MSGPIWSVEREQMLRTLWAEGLATAEIGRRMKMSKNGVVGKAHRLHLTARPSPITRRTVPRGAEATYGPTLPALPSTLDPPPTRQTRPAKASRPVAARLVPPVVPLARAPPPPALRLAEPCRWPIGVPGQSDFRFCGDPAATGPDLRAPHVYCLAHRAKAYMRLKTCIAVEE
jgi:GcrA cell cycle regulator